MDPDLYDREQENHAVRNFWLCMFFFAIQATFCILFLLYLGSRPGIFVGLYQMLLPQQSVTDVRTLVEWMNSSKDILDLHSKLQERFFTNRELDHYNDVRSWLKLGHVLLVPATFFWGVSLLALHHVRDLTFHQVQLFFVKAWGLLVLASVLWVIIDWSSFFAFLHYPFFGPDSWRFPANSYTVHLFPEWFWGVLGSLWILLPLAAAGTAVLLSPPTPKPHHQFDMRIRAHHRKQTQ